MSASDRIGFCGKLPSRGDFVRAALSRSLTEAWHRWQQPLLAAAQEKLGDAWHEIWWATRPWHFSLPPGPCGTTPVAGVWLASSDKAGRDYPLTIAAAVPLCPAVLETVEALGREAIERCIAPEALARRLGEVPCTHPASVAPSGFRWWRGGESAVQPQRRDRLPDLDGFIGMLTP